MSDGCYGMFLKVVRRQPMIVGTDKGLEERPCPACGLSQEEQLVSRSVWRCGGSGAGLSTRRWPARRVHNSSMGSAVSSAAGIATAVPIAAATATTGATHMSRNDALRSARPPFVIAWSDSRSTSRDGLHSRQPAMSEQHPNQRSHNRVEADIGVVRQTRQREQHLAEVPARGAHRRNDVLRQQHLGRFSQQAKQGGDDRRNDKNAQHRQRPEPAARQRDPPEHQQQRQRGRDETSS